MILRQVNGRCSIQFPTPIVNTPETNFGICREFVDQGGRRFLWQRSLLDVFDLQWNLGIREKSFCRALRVLKRGHGVFWMSVAHVGFG
jgi:hypothetical protein